MSIGRCIFFVRLVAKVSVAFLRLGDGSAAFPSSVRECEELQEELLEELSQYLVSGRPTVKLQNFPDGRAAIAIAAATM